MNVEVAALYLHTRMAYVTSSTPRSSCCACVQCNSVFFFVGLVKLLPTLLALVVLCVHVSVALKPNDERIFKCLACAQLFNDGRSALNTDNRNGMPIICVNGYELEPAVLVGSY